MPTRRQLTQESLAEQHTDKLQLLIAVVIFALILFFYQYQCCFSSDAIMNIIRVTNIYFLQPLCLLYILVLLV